MSNTTRPAMTTDQEATYRRWANVPTGATPPPLNLKVSDPATWTWGWNPPGLHYGPIPVGILLVLAWWLIYRH